MALAFDSCTFYEPHCSKSSVCSSLCPFRNWPLRIYGDPGSRFQALARSSAVLLSPCVAGRAMALYRRLPNFGTCVYDLLSAKSDKCVLLHAPSPLLTTLITTRSQATSFPSNTSISTPCSLLVGVKPTSAAKSFLRSEYTLSC